MRFSLFFLLSLFSFSLIAQTEQKEIAKISEAFGHLIGKNIETIDVKFDLELVIKGLQDAAKGKESPMSESECIEAIAHVQEQVFQKKAKKNLEDAEAFLKENAKQKNIVVIDEGKLQYKIEKKGEGKEVETNFSPVIHYIGKHLDGSIFGQSKEDEVIYLDETIPGFQKGLVGMKEGEKRTLFIHPDYGYGTRGYLPPNSLLTFEIEIIKANAPKEEISDPLILESDHESKISNDLDAPALR